MVSSIPLWRQLQAAASVLASVRAGRSATDALAGVDAVLRPGVQALVFQALRQLGRAEALRRQLAKRAPPPEADALLCLALALSWDADQAPYEVFTLVNQAVEAAKRQHATQPQAGFVNACLRRFLRERDALVAATANDPVAQWNHPRWWIARLQKDHPTRWQDILRASNTPAPMTLRVNARQTTPAQYRRRWNKPASAPHPLAPTAWCWTTATRCTSCRGLPRAWCRYKTPPPSRPRPLLLTGLPPPPGGQRLQVLDACAAPGGKTAHLLEIVDADVTALDVDPQRCERIHQTLQRIGLAARVAVGDAGRPNAWWDGKLFDAILLDAPCTASGIVRRHPDVRWLRRETDIAQLAATQARLLAALWPLLKPGGRLLYCTCSVFRAEGDAQIQTFVAHNTDASMLPSPGHLMPQSGANANPVPDNLQGDHDGFFYALLQKQPAPGLAQAAP
jgi:16S rRNA (cytosine967-C5)-methyltransferase